MNPTAIVRSHISLIPDDPTRLFQFCYHPQAGLNHYPAYRHDTGLIHVLCFTQEHIDQGMLPDHWIDVVMKQFSNVPVEQIVLETDLVRFESGICELARTHHIGFWTLVEKHVWISRLGWLQVNEEKASNHEREQMEQDADAKASGHEREQMEKIKYKNASHTSHTDIIPTPPRSNLIPYVVIHLASCTVRKQELVPILKAAGIYEQTEWFDAIQRSDYMGCTESHIAVIREAKERGLSCVCVLEDDVEFDQPPPRTLDELPKGLIDEGTEWDMIYLGYNFYRGYRYRHKWMHMLSGLSGHAYIVHEHAYDKILDAYKDKEYQNNAEFFDMQGLDHPLLISYEVINDIFYSKCIHQRYGKTYGVYPMIAHQRPTVSSRDITKRINEGCRNMLLHHLAHFEWALSPDLHCAMQTWKDVAMYAPEELIKFVTLRRADHHMNASMGDCMTMARDLDYFFSESGKMSSSDLVDWIRSVYIYNLDPITYGSRAVQKLDPRMGRHLSWGSEDNRQFAYFTAHRKTLLPIDPRRYNKLIQSVSDHDMTRCMIARELHAELRKYKPD